MNKKTLFFVALIVTFSLIIIGNLAAQSAESVANTKWRVEVTDATQKSLSIKEFFIVEFDGKNWKFSQMLNSREDVGIVMIGRSGFEPGKPKVQFYGSYTQSGNTIKGVDQDGDEWIFTITGDTMKDNQMEQTYRKDK
jgi:hypothetical protein